MWRLKLEKVNPNKELIDSIKEAFEQGGWYAAMEVCRNTEGKASTLAYELIEFFKNKHDKK